MIAIITINKPILTGPALVKYDYITSPIVIVPVLHSRFGFCFNKILLSVNRLITRININKPTLTGLPLLEYDYILNPVAIF